MICKEKKLGHYCRYLTLVTQRTMAKYNIWKKSTFMFVNKLKIDARNKNAWQIPR